MGMETNNHGWMGHWSLIEGYIYWLTLQKKGTILVNEVSIAYNFRRCCGIETVDGTFSKRLEFFLLITSENKNT